MRHVEAYLGDEWAMDADEKTNLHHDAMANYAAWQADRQKRRAQYDADVDAYHARLDVAEANARGRDRAEFAAYLHQLTKPKAA